ncbi:hypothetical protein FACS1894125_5600 [Actinomycetota bacterium]|nr:hypothetical protein FACS1894125_5600 [Actinomycetota bacterium]
MEDPIYAITMLAFKDGYAWSQPDFAYGIPQLYRSGGGFVESVGKDVFIGNTNKATFFFLDGYTSLVFFSALFGVFYLRKYPQLLCLPILFAAGFVYHSLFEINSVYMYPYFSILPTLSLVGLYEFYQKFHDRWHMIAQKCLRRVKGVRLLKD